MGVEDESSGVVCLEVWVWSWIVGGRWCYRKGLRDGGRACEACVRACSSVSYPWLPLAN